MIAIKITRDQNKKIRELIESHCTAYKNWIVSAVEGSQWDYAAKLARELREYQAMFQIIVPDSEVERQGLDK